MRKAFSASRIFTGSEWLTDHVIQINDHKIENIVSGTGIDSGSVENFEDCFIVPAFIDIQVYGAAQKLFAIYPEAGTLQIMNDEFLKEGTVLFLPTVATNTVDVLKSSIDAVKDYWKNGGKGVYGLHLEGPWLNLEKRGAHIKEWIHAPEIEEVKDLLDYGRDVIRVITIAPEVCNPGIIELILSYNIIISAGHSNATYEQSINSFDKGIKTVTHLFNAMSPLHHRQPGLVGASLNHRHVMASIIPDGHHVDYAAITIAKKLMGSRLFAITDAVTETNSGPYKHYLAGDKYECNGILSGSAISMHKAFQNLVHHCGIEIEEALRMCSLYPAQVLGCDDQYGKIAPQYAGQFIVMNKQLAVVQVIN